MLDTQLRERGGALSGEEAEALSGGDRNEGEPCGGGWGHARGRIADGEVNDHFRGVVVEVIRDDVDECRPIGEQRTVD